jgi:hypothetical protein
MTACIRVPAGDVELAYRYVGENSFQLVYAAKIAGQAART